MPPRQQPASDSESLPNPSLTRMQQVARRNKRTSCRNRTTPGLTPPKHIGDGSSQLSLSTLGRVLQTSVKHSTRTRRGGRHAKPMLKTHRGVTKIAKPRTTRVHPFMKQRRLQTNFKLETPCKRKGSETCTMSCSLPDLAEKNDFSKLVSVPAK